MSMSFENPRTGPDVPQGTPVHLGRLTLNLNIDYIKNLIGIVRLVTLGLSFLVFIFGIISGSGFAVFVALLALFVDATLIILHLLFVPEFHLSRAPWYIIELVETGLFVLFFTLVGIVCLVLFFGMQGGTLIVTAALSWFDALAYIVPLVQRIRGFKEARANHAARQEAIASQDEGNAMPLNASSGQPGRPGLVMQTPTFGKVPLSQMDTQRA
jgi:hypothetical protein